MAKSKLTVGESLSVRAQNAIYNVLYVHDSNGVEIPYEQRAKFESIVDLTPTTLKRRLRARAKERNHTVSWILRAQRGAGNMTVHEILRWIGESVPTDEHTCICRRCGRKTKQAKGK